MILREKRGKRKGGVPQKFLPPHSGPRSPVLRGSWPICLTRFFLQKLFRPLQVWLQLWGFKTPPPSRESSVFRLTHTLTKQDQQENTPRRDPFYSELRRFRLRGGDSSPSPPTQLYSEEEQPEKPPPAQPRISEKLVASCSQLVEPQEPP